VDSRDSVGAANALRATIAGLILASLAVNLVLHLSARSGVETVWTHVGRFLHHVQGADSWKPMETARTYTRAHAAGLYEQVFFTDRVKFQYPPTALLLFGALERPTLNLISWIATLATAGLIAVILRVAIRSSWGGHEGRTAAIALDALVVVAALTFYPFIKAYSLGQIQAWLNLLFAVLLLEWMRGRRGVAGAALGLICLVKPTYALLYLWGALRREWRFVGVGALVIGVGLALSLWRFGLHDHVEYLSVLSYIARHGEAFYANQSINGALHRLLFNGSNLEWHDHEFAPVHPIVYAGTVAAFVLLVAVSLRRPAQGAGSAVDLSLAALAATLTAPVAWEHHYGILLPIYAALTPSIVVERPFGRWTAAALGGSYLVAANYVQFTNHFAGSWLNPLQSYLLAAAVVLWALLYRSAHGSAQVCSSTPEGH
jgi:alpha-1,2-mannosyltransferase